MSTYTVKLNRFFRTPPGMVYPFGTELNIKQSGPPDVIPKEAYHIGWQELLARLTQPVETEI